MKKEHLVDLATKFSRAFNEMDLNKVMTFFSGDAVYDQLNGGIAKGLAAIEKAFEPQFSGQWGTITFIEEDVFVEAESNKVMSRFRCDVTGDAGTVSWRGLDILVFDEQGKISEKLTYAKAEAPLFYTSENH